MLMPDKPSVQVNVTVTGVLFQPLAFGVGETEAVMTGDVLSKLMVAQAFDDKPEVSLAVPQMD